MIVCDGCGKPHEHYAFTVQNKPGPHTGTEELVFGYMACIVEWAERQKAAHELEAAMGHIEDP